MDMTGLLTSPPQLNGKPQPKEFQTRKSMEKHGKTMAGAKCFQLDPKGSLRPRKETAHQATNPHHA